MIFVGIDVAKETHYAAIMNSDGVVLSEPFAFSNDASGFSKLTDKADTFLIIKSLMVNSYQLYSEQDILSLEMKSLCRFRKNIKKSGKVLCRGEKQTYIYSNTSHYCSD